MKVDLFVTGRAQCSWPILRCPPPGKGARQSPELSSSFQTTQTLGIHAQERYWREVAPCGIPRQQHQEERGSIEIPRAVQPKVQ